mmetsp:Transcript_50711/g.99345  ORF Transcript_50711/g.99345 Transcript_50711/m.99345 type:complete len:479 (-) Transcript_50711:137-1573(-)|eukprot:CAMPEP_0175140540 /NCGR_PEP_ID=MMETSP0087-20121206/11577_1 /TAXON_ID=136419 /ORGANISM="Unknown Unknown, Strain D1" /LENGTH=478 /DNA_ID=CAMNT_0016423797 /DNA_START=33 /DNA_END=1469 /DNA_ORIENTATION=-
MSNISAAQKPVSPHSQFSTTPKEEQEFTDANFWNGAGVLAVDVDELSKLSGGSNDGDDNATNQANTENADVEMGLLTSTKSQEQAHEQKPTEERKKEASRLEKTSFTSATEYESFLKTEDQIAESVEGMKKKNRAGVKAFYRRQNEIIDGLIAMQEISDAGEIDPDKLSAAGEPTSYSKKVQRIVNVSFLANIVLFGLKIAAAVLSGSLAVIASATDSLLDLISGSFMWFVSRFMHAWDPYKYPQGKARMEPLGIMIFAVIMGMTSLQIIKEGVEVLIAGMEEKPKLDIDELTLGVLGAVIGVKLLLYLYCQSLPVKNGMVEALAEDHRNDCVTNLVSAAAAVLAGYIDEAWWVDPAGAILFGLYILVSWVENGKERIGMLIGATAPPEMIGQLGFLAAHHDDRIVRVDTVRAYRFGERYLVECDIVLDPSTPLKTSHDVGEALQIKIERLPHVERAYVHLDYEWEHKPEHKVTQDLD